MSQTCNLALAPAYLKYYFFVNIMDSPYYEKDEINLFSDRVVLEMLGRNYVLIITIQYFIVTYNFPRLAFL